MIIRRVALARWRDTLVDLHRQCFPSDCEPDWARNDWWIAFSDSGAVGFAGGYVTAQDTYYLSRAGVLPKARGKGLQRRMIRIRQKRARALGLAQAITYTILGNPESSNNLIRTGFRLYTPRWCWGGKQSLYWWWSVG